MQTTDDDVDPLDAFMAGIAASDTVSSLRDVAPAAGGLPMHASFPRDRGERGPHAVPPITRNRRLEMVRRLLAVASPALQPLVNPASVPNAAWVRHFTLQAVRARAHTGAGASRSANTGVSDMLFAALDRVVADEEGDGAMEDDEAVSVGGGGAGGLEPPAPHDAAGDVEGLGHEEVEEDDDDDHDLHSALSLVIERFLGGTDPEFTPSDYASFDGDAGLDAPAIEEGGISSAVAGGAEAAVVLKFLWPAVQAATAAAPAGGSSGSGRRLPPLAEAEAAAQEAYFDTD